MLEAAEKHAEKEWDFIKHYFEDLSDHQSNVIKVALKSAYRSGYLHGDKAATDIIKSANCTRP